MFTSSFVFRCLLVACSILAGVYCSEQPPSEASAGPAVGESREHTVNQKNKEFLPGDLTVKVGDTVNFVNEDDFFHNVYSLSDARVFDLGSYPRGEGRKVKFDQPGEVLVECAIHDTMKMKIKVQE